MMLFAGVGLGFRGARGLWGAPSVRCCNSATRGPLSQHGLQREGGGHPRPRPPQVRRDVFAAAARGPHPRQGAGPSLPPPPREVASLGCCLAPTSVTSHSPSPPSPPFQAAFFVGSTRSWKPGPAPAGFSERPGACWSGPPPTPHRPGGRWIGARLGVAPSCCPPPPEIVTR